MSCVDAHGRNVLKKTPLIDTRNVLCDATSKTSKKPASSRNGGENQDPLAQGGGLRATVPNKCSGVSRLPVPIKSQHLKTKTDATQVQRKQQETTKSEVQKKSCTKPVPFNLSQPRTAKTAAAGGRKALAGWDPVAPQPRPRAGGETAKAPSVAHSVSTTVSSSGSAKLDTQRVIGSRSPPGRMSPHDSTVAQTLPLPSQNTHSSQTCPPLPSTLHPSTQFDPPCQGTGDGSTSAVQWTPVPLVEQTVPPSGCLKPANNQANPAETGGTADGAGGSPIRLQDTAKSSQTSTGPPVTFCPDPTALRMRPGPSPGATPRVFANTPREDSIYLPQRVPVRGRRAGGADPGNPMPFSPDPTALMSILRNEGVRAGETLRGSVCLTGRGSSNYLPQRVPVTKPRHAAGVVTGPPQAESTSSCTPTVRWTPQRVPNTRPQSMWKFCLTHRTPILRGTPKLESVQGFSSPPKSCKEENVVQRLFAEEDGFVVHSGGKNTDPQKHGFSEPEAVVVPSAEVEAGPVEGGEQAAKPSEGQPFIQAPHRGSVIVFAQGRKVLDTPGTAEGFQVQQTNAGAAPWDPHVHGHARLCATASPGLPPYPTSFSGINAGGTIQRPARLGLAASALRRRLQPLEEVLLDEECAMYTSQLSASSTQLLRCGNPVASTLHFKDSMCFAPVLLPSLSFGQLPSAQNATSVSSCGFTTDQ